MVAIPAGQRIDSGDGASTSCSASELAETGTTATEAESSLRPRRQVTNPSSSEEEEEEMVLRRRFHVLIANLEAQVFGDGAPDALTSAGDAPSLPFVPASTSPAAVVIVGTSTPATSPSVGA